MVFDWLDATDACEMGKSLAQFFMQGVPLDGKKLGKNSAKQQAKIFKVLDSMHLQIDQFKQGNKLNVYKKAQLGKTFKHQLIEGGYDSELVEFLTAQIIQRI